MAGRSVRWWIPAETQQAARKDALRAETNSWTPRVRPSERRRAHTGAALASCRGVSLLPVVFLVREETLDRLAKYEMQDENTDHQRPEENQQAQPERVADYVREQQCEGERPHSRQTLNHRRSGVAQLSPMTVTIHPAQNYPLRTGLHRRRTRSSTTKPRSRQAPWARSAALTDQMALFPDRSLVVGRLRRSGH
jgi:hypothetical protein